MAFKLSALLVAFQLSLISSRGELRLCRIQSRPKVSTQDLNSLA